MSAAKRKTAPLVLEGLNSSARAAATKAARQAGMSLDAWVAATVADRTGARSATVLKPSRAASAPDDLEAVVAKLKAVTRRPVKSASSSKGSPPKQPRADAGRDKTLAAATAESERKARQQAAKTAVALDSVASWIERAEDRLSETSRIAAEGQERTASMLAEALAAMTRRLDDIESKVEDGGRPSVEAALKAVERIEAQLAKVGEERTQTQTQNSQIEAMLRGFEEQIAAISERIAAGPRPIGRRGLASRDEVRSAVDEIRARQAELDGATSASARRASRSAADEPPSAERSHNDMLASLRSDIARLAGQIDTLRPAESASTAAAVHDDIERLQATVSGLATRDEINAIEHCLRALAGQAAKARAPGDVAAVTASIAELQAEMHRLSETVTTGLQNRLTRDLDALARKVDVVAGSGIDPSVVEGLSHQLQEVRRIVSELADPHRVQTLAKDIATLNDRLAELSRRQIDATDLARRFDALTRKLDDLGERPPSNDFSPLLNHIASLTQRLDRRNSEPSDLFERIDAISRKLDRLSEEPKLPSVEFLRGSGPGEAPALETLVQRLDRLDEAMRQPASSAGLKPIEDMLRALVERVEQVSRPGADLSALDALEKQVALLAERIDRMPGSDPALTALEQAMGQLMTQVETMRGTAYEAAERAAKTVVADTLSVLPKGEAPEFGGLKRDLADLQANHSAADRRTQSTLASVHAALEKVVARLGSLEQDTARDENPMRSGGIPPANPWPAAAPQAAHRIEEKTAPSKAAPDVVLKEADRPLPPRDLDEILLEPGAGRPWPKGPEAAVEPAVEGDPRDIRASLIASARRAAQMAQADAAANAKAKGPISKLAGGDAVSLAARVKQVIDKRRRPLLLGLAAIVLALGAIQTLGGLIGDSQTTTASAPTLIEAPPKAEAAEPQRALPSDEPKTTQAIPSAAPEPSPPPQVQDVTPAAPAAVKAEPKLPSFLGGTGPSVAPPLQISPALPGPAGTSETRSSVERIANIASVADIPQNIGVPGLRQAALAGDPAAIYDLASRAAEGRGMARDLKLAAKLFEKAAAHGVVPAQYRIGNHYEKGLGVTRDLALAKAWYQRAADKGNARAMHNLAVILAEGGGGKPDYAVAADWFRRAAEHGVRDSQFNLAVLLGRGLGVTQDLSRAYVWFAVAAAQGDDDAAKKRDEVGARMTSTEIAAARKAAEAWRAEIPSRAANEVTLPANGWSEAQPTAAPTPAPAPRAANTGKRV